MRRAEINIVRKPDKSVRVLLVLALCTLVLGCSSGDDAKPSPTAEATAAGQAAAPTAAQPSATSPATTAPSPTPQPTATIVQATPTATQPPPTPTATRVPPTATQPPPPTPTPAPGSIVIQLVSGTPGLTLNFTISGSSACVPNAFVLAADNVITVTCSNGEASFTIKFPIPPTDPQDLSASCSVEDDGQTPGPSSGLARVEFPDAITVVMVVALQDFEDLRCVITVP